jgi:hypothetical protein
MSGVGYTEIREVAQGMYARRVCGEIMDNILPKRDLDVDFDFVGLVARCSLPEGETLDDHRKSWALFSQEFDKEFKDFVNNRK